MVLTRPGKCRDHQEIGLVASMAVPGGDREGRTALSGKISQPTRSLDGEQYAQAMRPGLAGRQRAKNQADTDANAGFAPGAINPFNTPWPGWTLKG